MRILDKSKPLVVNIISGLLIFRFSIHVLAIIAFWFIRNSDLETESIASRIALGIADVFKLDMADPEFALGYLVGSTTPLIALTGLTLIFFKGNRHTVAVIFAAADVILSMPQGFPIIPAIVASLLLTSQCREYMKEQRQHRTKQY